VAGSPAIDAALVAAIASRDLAEWMDIFGRADVPVVPVNATGDVADDPQMRARLEWLDADQGTVTMKSPVRCEPALAAPSRAPAIGQDTADILGGLAIGPAERERLAASGVIRLGRPAST
jgi:crotonobetainyl-CoA:carnitine CoA-transferase CaiB-like acyl-CoA transferase